MLLSLHSLVFPHPKSIISRKILTEIKALGYQGIELIPIDYSENDIYKFKSIAESLELRILLGWSLDIEHNLISENNTIVKAGIEHMKKLILLAKKLNAPCLSGLNYAASGYLTGMPSNHKEWARAINAYREICEFAMKYPDLIICLEPATREESHLINTVEQGCEFIRAVDRPNVKLLLDTFQMLREENDIATAICMADDKIGNFHVSESHRGTLGTGTVPWKEVLNALCNIRYKGWIGVEAYIDIRSTVASRAKVWRQMEDDPLKLARNSIEYIHNHIS